MLARDANPRLLRCAAGIGPIVLRMDVEKRSLAPAVLQFVGMNVDHQHYQRRLRGASRITSSANQSPAGGRSRNSAFMIADMASSPCVLRTRQGGKPSGFMLFLESVIDGLAWLSVASGGRRSQRRPLRK